MAWAPGGIDGRHYDYAALGRHADMLFVMGSFDQTDVSVFSRKAKTSNPAVRWEDIRRRERREKKAIMGFIVYFWNRLHGIT